MHVMASSSFVDDAFWTGQKKANGRLPKGASWVLAIASADGTRAVNILVHESVDAVRAFFEEHAGPFATTECFEADAANAVGLR